MAEGAKIQAIRGVKDVLPSEVHLWRKVEETSRELFHRYGFREIRIPIFERTELFARGIGEGTDIVSKEMYTFEDRGGESITLRPEATASICRAYVEHRLFDQPGLAKLYCLGPMFRYERPQAGRYRQFYQLDAEAFGTDDPTLDAEVLALVWDLFGALGVGGLTLVLNSLGCPRCRPAHGESLRVHLKERLGELCDDCRRRAEVNPLRALDCKNKGCRPILDRAPSVEEFWCAECRAHLGALRGMLDRAGVPYALNPRLVRGLDYYVRTAFEMVSEELGAQNAVCGGGRYDGLVAELGGPPTPAIGFAAGIERIVQLLQGGREREAEELARPQVFLAALSDEAGKLAFDLARQLRSAGLRVERSYLAPDAEESDKRFRSLKSQLRQADRLGALFAVLIGEDEVKSKRATVRDLRDSTQSSVPLEGLVAHLRRALQGSESS